MTPEEQVLFDDHVRALLKIQLKGQSMASIIRTTSRNLGHGCIGWRRTIHVVPGEALPHIVGSIISYRSRRTSAGIWLESKTTTRYSTRRIEVGIEWIRERVRKG